jgi:hypothetical protein
LRVSGYRDNRISVEYEESVRNYGGEFVSDFHWSQRVSVTLIESGQLVFAASGYSPEDVRAYIPGDWEQHLSELARRSKREQAKEKKQMRQQEAERTKDRFGLK